MKQKPNRINIYNLLLLFIFIIIIIILYNTKMIKFDSFLSINKSTTTTKYIKNDGTKLYGSLFLDNLNNIINKMTDPPIEYDKKRVEIIKYSDILL